MDSAGETYREVVEKYRATREHIPDVLDGFVATEKASMQDGALSTKVKELIALAISATRQCDGCIAAHARSVARQQATDAEVAEAMAVVVMMNGGPGTVWGPRAFAAYREFSQSQS